MTETITDPDCRNCDGRGCMSCVFREMHDQCVDDCPTCCPAPPRLPAPAPFTVAELAQAIADSSSTAAGPIPEGCRLLAERVHARLCDTKGWAK